MQPPSRYRGILAAVFMWFAAAACTSAVPAPIPSELGDFGSESDGGLVSGSPPVTSAVVVSGNPAATNVVTGSGWLGDCLGINRYGWRFAGLNITDANGLLSGGLAPGHWTTDSLTIADISLDAEEFFGWEGAEFGTQFLYYTGGPVNSDAGTVMGYNSLDVVAPRNRAELYQLWYRQSLCDDRFIVRVGKSVPTYDFNNVVRSIPFGDNAYDIPAVSALIFTPLYVSPTQLGIMPGYYNSATGVVATVLPIKRTYVQYGFFDGNLANSHQTGLEGPHFNGYYLHLAETGAAWTVGENDLPGKVGIGGWWQTGTLETVSGPVDGATGMYLFGSQRLYYEHPGESDQGLLTYLQFAATNSDFVSTHRYFGFGLSYFGLLPQRDNDSAGFGVAYGKMTDNPAAGLGADEVILSSFYQWSLCNNCFFQPNFTYIPNPAQSPDIPAAFAISLRLITLY